MLEGPNASSWEATPHVTNIRRFCNFFTTDTSRQNGPNSVWCRNRTFERLCCHTFPEIPSVWRQNRTHSVFALRRISHAHAQVAHPRAVAFFWPDRADLKTLMVQSCLCINSSWALQKSAHKLVKHSFQKFERYHMPQRWLIPLLNFRVKKTTSKSGKRIVSAKCFDLMFIGSCV